MTKEKRFQIIGLVVGTLLGVFLIWYGVIRAQEEALKAKESRMLELREKIEVAKKGVALAESLRKDLDESRTRIRDVESFMAVDDVYRWIINAMRQYQTAFNVEVTDFDPPEPMEFNELPKVPYKAALFSVMGTGRYRDLGYFLAEIESQMPFVFIRKLEISAASNPLGEANTAEALTFQLQFTALVRTSEPPPEPGAPK